jgi:hypothetical protein
LSLPSWKRWRVTPQEILEIGINNGSCHYHRADGGRHRIKVKRMVVLELSKASC